MKTIWSVASFLAVVHLLSIALFAGWLWQTKRLSRERLDDVRSIFAMSVPAQEAAWADADRDAEARRQEQQLRERRQKPPLSSAAQIGLLSEGQEQTQLWIEGLENPKKQLRQQIALSAEQLEQERLAFEAKRRRWEKRVEAEDKLRSDAQFQKAIKLLETLPPKQAKAKIVELVKTGRTPQAVAYLDAMSPRAASKVLSEFKTDQENRLATELLERLRTFGTRKGIDTAEASSNADTVANSQ